MIIREVTAVFIALSGGLAVGSGFVAFLTVLGIIPRLSQISKTADKAVWYEAAIILGTVAGIYGSLRDPVFGLPAFLLVFLGLAGGVFVGMIAGALAEVLNVIPILAKRLNLDGEVIILLMAVVLGKIAGSLFQWLYFIHR
ncbi:stage V sporulation protein AB [Bacillus sp. FJAT-27225]|uniref:stage V sporulation protein AB n=1 Tax=Bacillus sp. FJAT-27225 TaxID=1743144 RepID=UPI0015866541|nr:stage V sporulation protein AB [Bacillus sp. FJAT-27225]